MNVSRNKTTCQKMVPGRATAASRRGRPGPLWHRYEPKGERWQKEKKGEEGSFLLARVSDVWTHGGGGLLPPTRAAPPRVGIASSLIGRGQSDGLFGAVAGARDRGAAIGFFWW